MALEFASGTFTSPSTATTKSITGLLFQPKVLIIVSGTVTSAGFIGASSRWMQGFAVDDDSTTRQCCGCVAGSDGQSTSEEVRHARSDRVIYWVQPNGTLIEAATVSAWNSDGITLSFSTANTGAFRYGYVLLGGSDITDVYAEVISSPASTPAESTYANPGFEPDLVMLGGAVVSTVGIGAAHALATLGAATSDTEQMSAQTWAESSVTTTDTGKGTSSSKICEQYFNNSAYLIGDLSEMNANGFKIDWTTVPVSSQHIPCLSVKGGQYKVGSFQSKTGSTGTKPETGTGFTPKGLLSISSGSSVANWNSHVADGAIGLGGGSSSSDDFFHALTNEDGVTTTDCGRGDTANFIGEFSIAAQSTLAVANISSLDSDGFTLNWTNIDSTQRQHIYVAMGDAAAAGGGPKGVFGLPLHGPFGGAI